MKNEYQTPKLRAVGRESPSPPLFLRNGERKRHVLLAAGPAASFGTFSRNFLEVHWLHWSSALHIIHPTTPKIEQRNNLQFSGLRDWVPRQQVLRIGDDGTQVENRGFLAWQLNERLVVSHTTTCPLDMAVLHSRSHKRALVLVFFRTIIVTKIRQRFVIFQSEKV